MNSSEKAESAFSKFINIYKYKDYDSIVSSTLNIKTSDISSYERTLLDIIMMGISEKSSVGELVSKKILLEGLIDAKSPEKDYFIEHLQKVEVLLEK